MSTSQNRARKGPVKRALGWLFEPTLPKYEDEPTRAQKRKIASGATSTKAKKSKAVSGKTNNKPAKAQKKRKVPLHTLSFEEQGERLGYIDKSGIIRMKANGREVGRVEDGADLENTASILGQHIERFRNHEAKVAELADKAETLPQSALKSVSELEETLQTDAGLGDPSAMLKTLTQVKQTLQTSANKLKADKMKVLQRADKLPFILETGEVDWPGSDAELGTITEDWHATGEIDAETQSELDLRYKQTLDAYTQRKQKFFTDYDGNARAKEKLVRKAQSLSQLNDVDTASAEFDALDRQWRSVGPADVVEDSKLRVRFQRARKDFEAQNAAGLEQRNLEKVELQTKKAALPDAVRSLAKISDPRHLSTAIQRQRNTLGQIESVLGQDTETKMLELQLTKESERAQKLQKEQEARSKHSTAKAEQIHKRLGQLTQADANGISWKAADQEMKDLREEAQGLTDLGRSEAQTLDQAFQEARRDFNTNRTAFFEKMDAERETNGARKRALINDLPFYKNGASAAELVAHLNASMEAWKKIGPAAQDENEALWESYRSVRSSLYDKVNELRDLEKDDFVARLAFTFEKKKEELYRLESEVNRESMLAEETGDETKAKKLMDLVDRKKMRVSGLQREILDIQRKLSKMSAGSKSPTSSDAQTAA